jgi:hypothetical protein
MGIALLPLDGFFLWRPVTGLRTGKIMTLGRDSHEWIFREESPILFWCWIGFHFLLFIVTFLLAIKILRLAFKQIKGADGNQ